MLWNAQNRINLVYGIGAVYTAITAGVAWFASSSVNKIITDNCNVWIKPTNSTHTGSASLFFEEASKQELCKWAPFIADAVIIAGTFQVFGMGLYGANFRVTDILKVKYGEGGLSSCLMNLIVPNSNAPFDSAIADIIQLSLPMGASPDAPTTVTNAVSTIAGAAAPYGHASTAHTVVEIPSTDALANALSVASNAISALTNVSPSLGDGLLREAAVSTGELANAAGLQGTPGAAAVALHLVGEVLKTLET